MKLTATAPVEGTTVDQDLEDYKKFGGAIVLINWLALIISTLIGYFRKDFVPWADQ